MKLKLAIQILQLGIALFRPGSSGLAQTMENLVQAVGKAYYDQFGRPIDPSLIKPEAGV